MDLTKEDTLGGWITLSRYCLVTGETRQSVHLRVRSGKWQRGVHIVVPSGGSTWINVPSVVKWIREGLSTPEDETPYIPLEQAMQEAGTVVEADTTVASTEAKETKPTYKVYIPELMQDEGLPGRYANLTGTDISGVVLGPLTGMPGRARQFDTIEECATWCAANSTTDNLFFPSLIELEYV